MANQKASRPGVDGTTDAAKSATVPSVATESGDAPRAQAERSIKYRGRSFRVIRTTRNRSTGAIYDYFEYDRPVKDRRTGKTTTAMLTKRIRRAGTGVVAPEKEELYTEEEL